MKASTILLTTFGVFLSSCCTSPNPTANNTSATNASGVSQIVADSMALCSGQIDFSSSIESELKIELTKIASGSGAASLDAGVKNAVTGIAFRDKDLTNTNVLKAQEQYNGCITGSLKALLNS